MKKGAKSKPGLRLQEESDAAAALEEQLRAERRIAELSRRFLALDLDDFDAGLDDALEAAAREAGADRAQFSWVRPGATGSPSLERRVWAAPGIEPIRLRDDEPIASFHWIRERLLRGETISVPRVEDLPDEAAAERDSLLEWDNRSYLAIPILLRGRFVGCLDVRCVRGTRSWSTREIERLQLIAEVLLSVLRGCEAQAARREAADRFDAVTENLEVTLCESDAEGRIVYASPRASELLGYSSEEMLSTDLSRLVHPYDRPNATCEGRILGNGASFRLQHRDGSWRTVEALGRSYQTRSGEQRFVSLLRDVSEQMTRNSELEIRLKLETLISELSRRLLSTETPEIDAVIQSGLGSVAMVSGADRAFLLSLPELKRNLPYFFEWCPEGGAARSVTPTGDDASRYRGFFKKLVAGEIVRIPVVADMSDEFTAERTAMLAAGIQSYLLVPAVSRGRLIGVLGIHCVSRQRYWSEQEVTLLRLVADLFTSALRRKRDQTALSESESRFRALAENSQDSICELSREGEILYASPAFVGLLGSARGDVEGQNLFGIAHALDRAPLGERIDSALHGVVGAPMVFRVARDPDEDLAIELTARGFTTAVGEPRVVAVLRDVTGRERDRRALERQIQAEKQVAELSRFFLDLEPNRTERALEEKLAVAGALAGAERCWMFTSDPRGEAEHRSCSWTADGSPAVVPTLIDSAPFDWAMAAFREGRELHVDRVESLPEEAKAECEELRGRGVRSFLGIPLVSGRRVLGLMGFEVASCEKRWSPEAITLLHLVAEIFVSALRREQAEAELDRSQVQLMQSQKMEAVGTLAGGIAHDFNNHLAVMLGNARFVAGALPASDGELRDALGDVQRSAEHCAQLTRSLLAFSRRSPVTIQPMAVGDVLAAVADLVRPLLPSSIQLRVEASEPHDAVRADPTQLRQVLINLVVNARDAMPEGGRLGLESRRRRLSTRDAWALGLPGTGSYVEILVSDDGDGMSEETRTRIFEPFFTTKQLGEGTGLGLATAYGIVQQCRGAIEVETELGRGTNFHVLLPLSPETAYDTDPSIPVDLMPGSETLLLVEDEPAVRRLLSRTLRKHGYRVFEAEDGVAGLAVAESEGDAIDLLVTDLVMPNLGGLELASKLQAQRPDLRVLFLSGHAAPDESGVEHRIQHARFLQKPFDDEALLQELHCLIQND